MEVLIVLQSQAAWYDLVPNGDIKLKIAQLNRSLCNNLAATNYFISSIGIEKI